MSVDLWSVYNVVILYVYTMSVDLWSVYNVVILYVYTMSVDLWSVYNVVLLYVYTMSVDLWSVYNVVLLYVYTMSGSNTKFTQFMQKDDHQINKSSNSIWIHSCCKKPSLSECDNLD